MIERKAEIGRGMLAHPSFLRLDTFTYIDLLAKATGQKQKPHLSQKMAKVGHPEGFVSATAVTW
jgi:hypothetical protein